MDPKIAKLDPKLKEAYERVMGTQVPASHDNLPPPPSAGQSPLDSTSSTEPSANGHTAVPPAPSMPPSHVPSEEALPPLPSEGVPPPPNPASPTPHDTPPPLPPSHTVDLSNPAPGTAFSSTPKVFQSFNVDSPTASAADHKVKAKISPVILVLAAVVFFVVYAFLWIRVFNIGLF